MSLPLVSVIIPTYNRSSFVMEAVDSVFKQTFGNFELIVVDDGSTDGTAEFLSRYQGGFIYTFQNNQGVSTARNRGLQMACGKWIAFLDSDDLWLPGKLEAQIRFLSKNPGAMICQTEEIWIRNGRRLNPGKKHQKISGDIFAPSLLLCLVSPSAVMIKREVFERVGYFDEGLPACEDYDLWLRISAHFPVFLIDQPLVIKRGGHSDQLSRTIPGLDRFRIRALVKILSSGRLSAGQYDLASKELKTKCRIYGQGCLKRGKTEEGNFYLDLPGSLMENTRNNILKF
ncbi:MAG: glycosyl transferase [Deltaproteobacteria bacterium RBG_13_43_22]|nr:MAG: glycosyl transferase [Deltaproteobacteria bacterium RBG_13_43_22]